MISKKVKHYFESMASASTKFAGGAPAFMIAIILILAWGVTGPIFKFSNTWQLVMNTLTSIVTFLMVFLIQHAQNKDSLAIQLKLNELVASMKGASNRLVNAEALSEEELQVLKQYYDKLYQMSKKEEDFSKSHSIEEATEDHKAKLDTLEEERKANEKKE